MKKRFSILTLAVAIGFSAVATFQMTYVYCARTELIAKESTPLAYDSEKLAYVDQIYREQFVGELDPDAITDAMIKGYMVGAGEVFGGYLTAEEYAEYMTEREGSLVGIGITVVYNSDEGLVQIVAVNDGSPAKEAGILPGDKILSVDGKDAKELGYEGVVNTISGEEGTDVTLTVLRTSDKEEKKVDFTVKRAKVESQSVYYHMASDGITGVIRITGFAAKTPEQFKNAVEALKAKGMTRVVFDLRGNPGGELDSVASVLDYILPEGDIIIAIDREGNKTTLKKSVAGELDMPMATLVDGGSASASELFSGCFRDYEKGPLIGSKTYGKGSMQQFIAMPDGSAVKITYRKFTSPSGFVHDGVGFTPDIEASLPEEYQDVNLFLLTEEQDTVLGEAIKYLNGERADN